MPSEQELLERIRQLEEQNNELQDKLDTIYSILAPDYESAEYEESGDEPGGEMSEDNQPAGGLVNIEGIQGSRKPS